jgi:hypothetical protein
MQQVCKVCWKVDRFNFHVPDEIWASVVPPEFRSRVVCLSCFDGFAREAGVLYASSLEVLYFAGDRATFEFRPVLAVDHR